MYAAANNATEAAKVLIDADVNVNAVDTVRLCAQKFLFGSLQCMSGCLEGTMLRIMAPACKQIPHALVVLVGSVLGVPAEMFAHAECLSCPIEITNICRI